MGARKEVSVRKNLIANYLARGWSAIIGLAFIPVYANLMGVEAMGVIGLFVTFQALCMLLDAGLSTTLNRELARMSAQEGQAQDMRDLLRTFEVPFWIAAFLGGAIVASLAPYISHQWVQVRILSPNSVELAIRLMGFVLFFQLPLSLYGGGLLGIQRQVEYSLLTAAWYTMRFAGVVVALKFFGPTLSVFFVWQVIVSAMATGSAAVILWRALPKCARGSRINWRLLESRWKFAAGIGGISLTLLVLNNVDKLVLSRMVSLKAFGYYTLGWTLANSIRLFADPIFITFFPRLSQVWASGNTDSLARIYHRISRFMTLAVVPPSLTIAFFAPEAMLGWTRSPTITSNTYEVLRLLAIGNLCLALTIVPYALQLASGWTSLALWSNIVGAVILVPLMVLLAGAFGTLGGGIAWVCLNFTYLVITVALMHRRLLPGHGFRWALEDLGGPLVASTVVLATARIFLPVQHFAPGAFGVLALSLFAAITASVLTSPLRFEIFTRIRFLYKKGDWGSEQGLPIADAPFKTKRACFFVKTRDPRIIERNEFYKVDMRILEQLGFDVIICTNPFRVPKADFYFIWWWTWAFAPLLIAKLIGKPNIVVGTFDHVMGGNQFQVYPHRPYLHRAIIRWALKHTDANVVCGKDQAALMRETFKMSRLEYVPHVLATEVYCPVASNREPFFVTLCWMHSDNAIRKCVATSIRAMAAMKDRLPDHRLLVVGDKGSGYPALAELVEELGLGDFVEFPGLVSVEEKISLLQRCRAYLQPTLAEGFGVAILEGMSCGAPVIVSPVGAVPEVVGDCALLASGMDVNGLAEAMFQVASDPGIARDLSERGRKRAVEEFSYNRRLTELQRIITAVMA